MQVLDMTQPIGLGDIYTDVNILDKMTGLRRFTLEELHYICHSDGNIFDRLGWVKGEERIEGLEAVRRYNKLMIWGKPGAGKTTFLKYLAIACIKNQFASEKVPIFVTLKQFAETEKQPTLLTYIFDQFREVNVKEDEIKNILAEGRCLILLDGLDEVRPEHSTRIINQIQQFADRNNYRKNQLIITCRIAAKDYTFQGFKEVEVADFDREQIEEFVNKWFQKKDPSKIERFISRLEDNQPIEELATNPLLLTLLCLVFGEIGDFPSNTGELYREGIDILLKKWDAKCNIQREQVYKQLSPNRKEDLLSYIAFKGFQQGNYFFKQVSLEQSIADYIENLPDAKSDPEALRLDSEAVLKSIEAQHGLLVARAKHIYSFSHLTFQEYFAARKIAINLNNEVLEELVSHLVQSRWRDIFLLTMNLLEDGTELVRLMKQSIDNLVAKDDKIQQVLKWLQTKANSVEVTYSQEDFQVITKRLKFPVSQDATLTRVFYLDLSLYLYLDLNPLYLYLYLDLYLYLGLDLYLYISLYRPPDLNLSLDRSLAKINDPIFKQKLQILRNKLPDIEDTENFKQWWKVNGKKWTEDLRQLMIQYRNIGHDWQFSQEQKELIKQYYKANQLLMECLNRECVVERKVRVNIEETLFLPISQIKT